MSVHDVIISINIMLMLVLKVWCFFYLFLTFETQFVLFLAVLENSVLPMG